VNVNVTIAAYQKEFDEIQNQYRINIPATDEHLVYFPTLKKGELISQNPEVPQDPSEAFELLKNYYAALQCVICKMLFIETYYTWNEPAIRAEIQLIEDFIKEANKLSYTKACNALKKSVPDTDEDKLEYLRLKNGFYEGYQMIWSDHSVSSRPASVYGKYFLFYDFLKARLRNLTKQGNSMEHFNNFINEIQSLDIRVKEHYLENRQVVPLDHLDPDEHPGLPLQKSKFWDLSNYNQDKSNYEAEITRLQQLAINDILLLTPEQIRMQLNRVELIKARFSKFWEVFLEKE